MDDKIIAISFTYGAINSPKTIDVPEGYDILLSWYVIGSNNYQYFNNREAYVYKLNGLWYCTTSNNTFANGQGCAYFTKL